MESESVAGLRLESVKVSHSASALPSLFSAEIERGGEQSPALMIDASGEADYQVVAKVLATAQNAGLTKIKFE